MKKIFLFLIALFALATVNAQSVLPEFSTTDAPKYYVVQFKNGNGVIKDTGAGNKLQTAAYGAASENQWQLIGSAEGFYMLSKTGRYVGYSGGRFTATDEAGKVQLALIQSPADAEYWEIKRAGQNNTINQWGGAGTGKELGEWTAGDPNNPLRFVPMTITLPEFSDDVTEKWYFLKMPRSNRYMADLGVGECVTLVGADPVEGQLWKLVGTQDNFQLVNQLGHYMEVSTKAQGGTAGGNCATPIRVAETEQPGGFSLSECGGSEGPGWQIGVNNRAGNYFNLWGGAQGTIIGLWTSATDNNNFVTFIEPEAMRYDDFKTTGIAGYEPEHKLTLWYDQPATTARLYAGGNGYSNWMEYSLPIGNGQFGASLFGGVMKDEIQFNEKTLWSGRSTDNSASYGKYENFGSVYAEELGDVFSVASTGAAKDYYRQLDLTTGTGKVSFKSPDGSVTYTREYFASNPDKAVVARYSASEAGKINLRFTMVAPKALGAQTAYADGGAGFSGKLQTVSYDARMKVVPTGGEMTTGEDGVTVLGADEVTVVLYGATDFDAYSDTYVSNTAALAGTVEAVVNDAAAKGWAGLYAAHLSDFKSYFDRASLDLDGTSNTVPTNELVDTYADGNGPNARMLEQLYFAYGRYLEISSSRGVDLPSNLQGIWNNIANPSWNSDIHSNINVQMNYWPAEQTNLSEMHLPFLNYIINMADSKEWKGYAAAAGQNRGWTCYTENNIFGGVGSFMHNYVISNAWYCTHLWQHYRYTLDRDFLKRAFPAMLSATQFWLDRLKLASDGTYEAPQEYSPEHGPTEDGVAHAQQLIYDLFENTLAAAEVLGDDAPISGADKFKLKDRFSKLDKGLAIEEYTGEWGADVNGVTTGTKILREWKYSNFTRGQNGHRHMSHLMCLYPFSQIQPGTELFEAAVNSMKLRGDGATGWSMGWKINLWARAKDGDHAHTIVKNALRHSGGGAGVFYNLYDSHAPFQIDGNFGACAGMAEMLMQSQSDTIEVLPALPSAWTAGEVKGLKAIGDFTVSIVWKGGKATRVTVVNNQGQSGAVKCPGIARAYCSVDGNEINATLKGDDVALLPATAGAVVVFDFTQEPTGVAGAPVASDLGVAVSGRTVNVSGEVKSVKVYDLAGRELQRSAKNSFKLGNHVAGSVIIEATATDGAKAVNKVTVL